MMEQESFGSVLESLEAFLQLKQQNFLIHAWIKIKNQGRGNKNSRSQRSNNSNYPSPYNPYQLPEIPKAESENYSIPSPAKHPVFPIQRLVTDQDYIRPQGFMFETFQKNSSAQWQRGAGTGFRAPQFSNHRQVTVDPEDSDEFEDIVLDRLSKLEESVNQMMREKKMKEHLRGYVGAPIQKHRFEDFEDLQGHHHLYYQPPTDRTGQVGQRWQIQGRNYQSCESSPKRRGRPDIVFNMKYLPVADPQSPVNIGKIRRILEQKSQHSESQANSPREEGRGRIGWREKAASESSRGVYPLNAYQYYLEQPKKKRSTTNELYLNYGYSQTTKNQPRPSQLLSKHIEMQSVIERGTRFARSPKNKVTAAPELRQAGKKAGFGPSCDESQSGYSFLSMPGWQPGRGSPYYY